MDPRQHIETYKNLNVKDYVHSLYQAKYLTSLNNVIIEGAKYNKEFASIPKTVIKSLNEEYDIQSPYFNLVKGNDKYKPKRKPKKTLEDKPRNKSKTRVRGGEVPTSSGAAAFLSTGVISN